MSQPPTRAESDSENALMGRPSPEKMPMRLCDDGDSVDHVAARRLPLASATMSPTHTPSPSGRTSLPSLRRSRPSSVRQASSPPGSVKGQYTLGPGGSSAGSPLGNKLNLGGDSSSVP